MPRNDLYIFGFSVEQKQRGKTKLLVFWKEEPIHIPAISLTEECELRSEHHDQILRGILYFAGYHSVTKIRKNLAGRRGLDGCFFSLIARNSHKITKIYGLLEKIICKIKSFAVSLYPESSRERKKFNP